MSKSPLKVEKDMCRCCHVEGEFKSLYASYFRMKGNELEEFVYSDMLRECYGIELASATESSDGSCGICHTCVMRLRDARDFKLQVLECEEKYRTLYMRQIYKQEQPETVDIKLEKVDPIDEHGSIEMDDFDHIQIPDIKQEDDELSENEALGRKKISEQGKVSSKVIERKNVAHPKKNAKPTKMEEIVVSNSESQAVKPFRLLRHIDYKRVGDMFQCCRCEKSNKSLNPIRDHIKSVHLNIPKYACTEPGCTKTFIDVGPFTKHKFEAHNIDERLRCNACDRLYTSKVQLRKHKNSFHMMGRVRKCDMCSYECYSAANLRKHKLVHKTVKDLHCKYCRKAFVRHSNLRLHEKIHTGVKDKVCNECGQAFVQKASLNYHMTKYHPGAPF